MAESQLGWGAKISAMPRLGTSPLVMTSAGIERCLCWLGEPSNLAPARDPPFFESQVIRRRLAEPAQAEMFDVH